METPCLMTLNDSSVTVSAHENFCHIRKNVAFSSTASIVKGTYCCCYTPVWTLIKDAGDGCRRGCQSSRGPWGEQKAGGGVAQPLPRHNDQSLTLQGYHHTHGSKHDTFVKGGDKRKLSELWQSASSFFKVHINILLIYQK